MLGDVDLVPAKAIQALDEEVGSLRDAAIGDRPLEEVEPAVDRGIRSGEAGHADVVEVETRVQGQVRVVREIVLPQLDLPPVAVALGLAVGVVRVPDLCVGLALRAQADVAEGLGRFRQGAIDRVMAHGTSRYSPDPAYDVCQPTCKLVTTIIPVSRQAGDPTMPKRENRPEGKGPKPVADARRQAGTAGSGRQPRVAAELISLSKVDAVGRFSSACSPKAPSRIAPIGPGWSSIMSRRRAEASEAPRDGAITSGRSCLPPDDAPEVACASSMARAVLRHHLRGDVLRVAERRVAARSDVSGSTAARGTVAGALVGAGAGARVRRD